MNKIKIFFDTNILVYAHDQSSIHHLNSSKLLKLAIDNQVQGVLAEQNIIELYRILTNPSAMKGTALTPQTTHDLIQNIYLNGDFQILYPIDSTLSRLLKLAVQANITSARIFDIRLAALALENKIDYFCTYNTTDFQNIPGLKPFTPSEIIQIIKPTKPET